MGGCIRGFFGRIRAFLGDRARDADDYCYLRLALKSTCQKIAIVARTVCVYVLS